MAINRTNLQTKGDGENRHQDPVDFSDQLFLFNLADAGCILQVSCVAHLGYGRQDVADEKQR